jgi:hypothetical protein
MGRQLLKWLESRRIKPIYSETVSRANRRWTDEVDVTFWHLRLMPAILVGVYHVTFDFADSRREAGFGNCDSLATPAK